MERMTRLALTLHRGRKIKVGQAWVSLRRDSEVSQVHLVFEAPASVIIQRSEIIDEVSCRLTEKGVD